MKITEQLDAIEARANAATEGPWVTQSNCDFRVVSDTHTICEASPRADRSHGMTQCVRNSAFIAASRQDVPKLCAALREAEEALTKCDQALKELRVANEARRGRIIHEEHVLTCAGKALADIAGILG